MQAERNPRLPAVLLLWACIGLLSLWLSAIPCAAQRWTFHPSVTVAPFTTSNVRFVGDSEDSDFGLRLGIHLPVSRQLRSGSLGLSYSSSIERFKDFSDLDHNDHTLGLSLSRSTERGSAFGMRVGYARTQSQGVADSVEDTDLFVRRPTEQERASLSLTQSGAFNPRWGWQLSAGASNFSFTEVSPSEGDPSPTELEDRTEIRGAAQISRVVSQRTSVGLSFGYRQFDLDLSGQERSQSLSGVLTQQLAKQTFLALSLGAFRSTGAAAGSDTSGDSRSGAQGSLTLTRSMRHTRISLVASHQPSAGGARVGTSTNTVLGLTLNGQERERLGWAISARVARRDPSDPLEGEIDSFAVGASLDRSFGRRFGLRLGGEYVDQSSQNDVSEDQGSFFRLRLGLLWNLLGKARIGDSQQ